MDDMQLEALRRAQTMRSAYRPKQPEPPPKEKPKQTEATEKTPEEPPVPDTKPAVGSDSPLDLLLKDRESSLILMLIFFLYEDNSDPILIMALIYLLID